MTEQTGDVQWPASGQISLRLHTDPPQGAPIEGAETVTWTSAWTASTGGTLLVSARGERSAEEMAALVRAVLPRRS